ncbi:MAG: hypothetical protein PHO63_01690 [Bacilli bacterium]|nr:hypothetical protein [Bacilli bacterium]
MEIIIGLISAFVVVCLIIFMIMINKKGHKKPKVEKQDRMQINAQSDFKMVVDDVFTIAGRGIAVSGTIRSGLIKLNEEVEIYGLKGFKRKIIITGIMMYNQHLEYTQADDAVILTFQDLVAGEIEKGDHITKGR